MKQNFKKIFKIISILIIFIFIAKYFVMAANTVEIEPEDTQYFELSATKVIDIEGKNKQVIMELWGYNIEFKGFDVRFSYDSSKINPSNFDTNMLSNEDSEIFKFENEFSETLDLFTLRDENIIRAVVSLKSPSVNTEHIVDKDGIGKVINTNGGVLLGKMSFQMTADTFDSSWFKLVQADSSPKTGIKINLDGINNYQKQSTFRFADNTESKNADLKNITVSEGQKDIDYKEYMYNPAFNKEILNYELTILEYKDYLNITAIKDDQKATMKLKVPMKDENNNLIYEADGKTIKYDEENIEDNIETKFKLNKLGDPDTLITIVVTAEDKTTVKEYKINIKRPYGTIKGSIQLGENLRESIQESYGKYVEYVANITAYEEGVFDWDGVVPKTTSLDDLDSIEYKVRVQSDKDNGTYELYIIPGHYDLLLERLGFLADVIKGIDISENEVIDLGNRVLLEGDVDRSGIIDLDDIVTIVDVSDSSEGDGIYDIKYDFGQKGFVAIDDLVSTVNNSDNLITIEEY